MPLATGDEKPTVADLQGVGLFGALDDEVLVALSERARIINVAAGEVVFREGDAGRAMYVVLSGDVELMKTSKRGNVARIALVRAGDWFGEMSLVDVMARSFTARALTPMRLVEIRPTHLDALYRSHLKGYALLIMNLARQLSRKLRLAEGILAETVTNVIDHYVEDTDERR